MTAFAGIDVAFAKGKRLPVAVCAWEAGRLVPLPLRQLPFAPPAGSGNARSCDPAGVRQFAEATVEYLRRIETHYGIQIERIGIDAPSSARRGELPRRAAEAALDKASISCFTTPTSTDFHSIRDKVQRHLASGGAENRLPHANQLWMQVGFELFRHLGIIGECVEVYPQATVRRLGIGTVHKSRAGAVESQLAAVAVHTGWPSGSRDEPTLREIAWGPRHDQLDAYLSAWVAALDPADRTCYGNPPSDAIWVPRVSKQGAFADPVAVVRPGRSVTSASRQTAARSRRNMRCPGCTSVFIDFPLGWDAHAAHRCSGLDATEPGERKREYKNKYGHLFKRHEA